MPPQSHNFDDIVLFLDKAGKPHKRLQKTFRVIYFVVSLANKVIAKKALILPRILHGPSYVAIDIRATDKEEDDGNQHVPFLDIDQKALSGLVTEKNFANLNQYGGVKEVAEILETDQKTGISSNQKNLQQRIRVFGSNTYKKPPAKSFLGFVYEAFKDTTIIILLVCACLSLGFGIKQHGPREGWYDGGSIIIAIVLVVAVSAISNYKQSKQFQKLSDVSRDIKVEVVRDGRRQPISIFEVVVGDILCLKIGDQIPADGLFLDGHSMKVDESSMTGESDHVEVDETRNPFLLSGTKVTDGYGRMLVTSVGMNTAWGEMMSSITGDSNEQTPLQARLDKLTSHIGKVGLLVAFLVLVVLLVRYFTGNTKDELGHREFNRSKTKANEIMNAVVRIVAAAVTIIVVAIPEGLPLAVTLTLAYSMKRMMGDNAMVRKLSACETMGSATTIVNAAALAINFVAALSSGEVPLTAVQMLWLNLIMDTLGALALATEQPTNDLMSKPPVGRTQPLITRVMWRNLIAQALYQVTVLLILQFKGTSIFGVNKKVKDTLIFNTFVMCQVFNEFNARKLEEKNIFKEILKNKIFLGIIGTTVVLQVVMVEFLKRFANTERLNWGQWVACILIAAVSWPIGWLVKFIPVSSTKESVNLPHE